LFWIKSISPRRQQSSNAPMMRSWSDGSDELMLGRVHLLQRGIEQLLFLLS
jgi:hypothetical protein